MSILKKLTSFLRPAPRATPAEHGSRVRSGEVLLVDVREPDEWAGGVAERAVLLPFSELRTGGGRWQEFLAAAGTREVLLYCASGMRSGLAARQLRAAGVRAINAGGLGDWAAAGWPVEVRPDVTQR